MKKILILSAIIAMSLSACNIAASTPAPTVETVSTDIALTEQPATPAPSGIPVSFQNVSFVIPEGLATGATPELVPAVDGEAPWIIAPEHIVFTLTGYMASEERADATIQIYPVEEYAAVNSWAENSLTKLRAVLVSPDGPLTNENLPRVPFNGSAGQDYAAQAKLLDFNGGSGVRMISQYGQFPGPVTKDGNVYHYEGLTSDGKYMVAIMLPVILPLQSTAENPAADGVPVPEDRLDETQMNAYYQAIGDILNSKGPDSFTPSLNQLDALISSIQVVSQ